MSIIYGILDKRLRFFNQLNNQETEIPDELTLSKLTITGNDGLIFEDPYWDDIRFPAIGQQIDVSAGRIDYDYTNVGIGFQNNTRYPEEVICVICQMQHKWKLESSIHAHIHYAQNQNKVPNWLIEYRVYNIGGTIPASWTKLTGSDNISYNSGTIHQLHDFGEIDMTNINTLSAIVEFKIYRDTANASSQFSGADPYTGTALLKEFDIHYQLDTLGSKDEYVK